MPVVRFPSCSGPVSARQCSVHLHKTHSLPSSALRRQRHRLDARIVTRVQIQDIPLLLLSLQIFSSHCRAPCLLPLRGHDVARRETKGLAETRLQR